MVLIDSRVGILDETPSASTPTPQVVAQALTRHMEGRTVIMSTHSPALTTVAATPAPIASLSAGAAR